MLRSVPDFGPRQLSPDARGALRTLAEAVIAPIEDRVSTADDPEGVQRTLVEAIYDIRRALEEMNIWRRRYTRTA